nr:hypothetical protein [Sphingomonas bacterium]
MIRELTGRSLSAFVIAGAVAIVAAAVVPLIGGRRLEPHGALAEQ